MGTNTKSFLYLNSGSNFTPFFKEITIPEGVTVTVNDNVVTVKGPKGELTNSFNKDMKIDVNENILTITRPNDLKTTKSLHGTTNALIENMIIGVSEGYKKELEIMKEALLEAL